MVLAVTQPLNVSAVRINTALSFYTLSALLPHRSGAGLERPRRAAQLGPLHIFLNEDPRIPSEAKPRSAAARRETERRVGDPRARVFFIIITFLFRLLSFSQ